nr:type IV secretion system protein [Luteibacter sp. Sphag1AF]
MRGTDGVEAEVRTSTQFELTIADLMRSSARRAWWVAVGAVGMALILALVLLYVLPLKEKVPYLVIADAYTGTANVAKLTADATHQRVVTSDAINRSNVAHFVLARESYDVAMMNLRDWVTVLTMSSSNVVAAYRALHAPSNNQAPYNVYGAERAIRVNILSIVLIDGEPGKPPGGATVRFQRRIYNKRTGSSQPLDSKIATMAFTYKPNLRMDEKSRIENPLGFQVTSYRVDNDFATPPPEEVTEEAADEQPAPIAIEHPTPGAAPESANSRPIDESTR